MIKKHIIIGQIDIELQARNGVGSIKTPLHKWTKAIYEMIQKRSLQQVGIGLNKADIVYMERCNAIIEKFPGEDEQTIMRLIEADINNPEVEVIKNQIKKDAINQMGKVK
jgi:hypothetical protein